MNVTSSPLSIVRAYLAARYQKELGQTLVDGGEPSNGRPVWRLVRRDDLRSRGADAPNAAGVLLDAELGLVLFVIPFTPGEDLQTQVAAALNLQASLQPLHPPVPPSDESGPWQVALHWLVEAAARDSWESQMVQLRQRAGCSEELVLEAVFYARHQLDAALAAHGLPRLLFAARHVLSQSTPAKLADWMSADRAVLREFEDFPELFSESEQRKRAQAIQDHLGEVVLAMKDGEGPLPEGPSVLEGVEVRDFRNLGRVQLRFGPAPVSCRVIHGPNGTGKTNLFEALCLALCGSSARYRDFLAREEKDIAATDRRRAYAERYLVPVTAPGCRPRIGLNGAEPVEPHLVNSHEEATRLDHEFDGNLLAQETSQEFLQLSSEALAARVLTGCSECAERLEAFVEKRVGEAARRRQEFLRGLGLSASISLIDTALARLAEQTLARELPQPAVALQGWFDGLALHPEIANQVGPLRSDWRQWRDEAALKKLTAQLTSGSEAEATLALETWLEDGNRLTRRTRELFERLDAPLAPLRDHFEEMLRDLTAWGEWLARRPSQPLPASPPRAELETFRRQLAEVQAAQQKAMKEGQATRQHLDHLDQTAALIAQSWAARQPNQCPTCGTDHAGRGGIQRVVEQLRAEVGAARERLLREYRALDDQAKAIQRTLQERGEAPCPLSAQRQAMLKEALAWMLPAVEPPLEARLKEAAQRSRFIGLLRALQTRPPLAAEANPHEDAQRVWRAFSSQSEDAREIWFDEAHWKPVQAQFKQKLAKVMTEHLPATLQRLWVELALNLTPAPWLLPERPAFDVVSRRGARRVTVQVNDRLARYLLNQGETHLLGLGWFFARYLTHGRFRGHFLIMDDPAQQLDQTSYRDLCRLWRVVLRLHSVRRLPLRLVLFLHQEDRAREAACATHGLMHVLGWMPEQRGELRELQLFAPGAASACPAAWFQKAERAGA